MTVARAFYILVNSVVSRKFVHQFVGLGPLPRYTLRRLQQRLRAPGMNGVYLLP